MKTPAIWSGKLGLLLTRVFLICGLWFFWSTYAQAEEITSFISDIEISPDGSALITETITYDFGPSSKHGIFRNIKNHHPQESSSWYKVRYIDYELLSVTRNNLPEKYTLESYQGLSAKIGDPNLTITGSHVYEIKYLARGILAEYPEGIELYWNVTGDEWPVTIKNVQVNVRGTNGVKMLSNYACYAGYEGSNVPCSDVSINDNGTTFVQFHLGYGQQLTVAQKIIGANVSESERLNIGIIFTIGVFITLIIVILTRRYLILLLFPFFPITLIFAYLIISSLIFILVYLYNSLYDFPWHWVVVALFMCGLYFWKIKNKPHGTIIPQYEPYSDFKPVFTGMLIDGRFNARDITAGIVYLAQQGFISIKKIEKKHFWSKPDYEITLRRPVGFVTSKFEKDVLELFFDQYAQAGKVTLSFLEKSKAHRSINSAILRRVRRDLITEMVEKGFLEQRSETSDMLLMMFPVALFFFYSVFQPFFFRLINITGVEVDAIIFTFIYLSALYVIFSLVTKERRSSKGYEAFIHLKGFAQFLSVTDKERYGFHNSPEKSPEQFLEYLPYAIALGVEEKWARVFKNMDIEYPNWYEGSGNFGSGDFTSDLNSFSDLLGKITSAPKSPSFGSSGGFGGSSGGGSSGGGGGGGGGGSW